jgi:hypothetical protein
LLSSRDMIVQTAFSQRVRPAVCGAALELHLLSLRCLSDARDPKATKILHATERAAVALELAAVGHRRDDNLRRAQKEMTTSLVLVEALHLIGRINARVCDHLRRRIDQVVSGVEQMIIAPPGECLALELPPLEEEAKELPKDPVRARWRQLIRRVAETARSLLAPQEEPQPPAQPTPEDPPGE